MPDSLSWFPLYHGDYLRDTGDLSAAEHGVFLLLLMAYVSRGPLPDDLDRLCRISAGANPQEVRGVLERYWSLTDLGWINGKMQRVLEKQREKHQRRVDAGRKGGQSKASNARAMLEQCSTNQNQNQNHIQEDYVPPSGGTSETSGQKPAESSTRDRCPYVEIQKLWAEICPGLPQPVKLSPARKAAIRARWNDELPDLDSWRECFGYVAGSKFLSGKKPPTNGRTKPFMATLHWVVKQENLLKIYEGEYDD